MTDDELITRIEELLFAADPVGINFESNSDEYRPEARSIVARRHEVASLDDLERIVHEVFAHWFDPDVAGPADRYRPVAESIWTVWKADTTRTGATPG